MQTNPDTDLPQDYIWMPQTAAQERARVSIEDMFRDMELDTAITTIRKE